MTEAYQDKRALKKIDNELKIQQLWYITLKLVIGVGGRGEGGFNNFKQKYTILY